MFARLHRHEFSIRKETPGKLVGTGGRDLGTTGVGVPTFGEALQFLHGVGKLVENEGSKPCKTKVLAWF